MGDQRAVSLLVLDYFGQGEGDAAVPCRLAHSQQHDDQRQLVGHHGHHFAGDAHAGVGGAAGRAAHDDGHGRNGQQVEDDHHVGHAAEGGKAEHRHQHGGDHQGDQADDRRRQEGAAGRGRGYDGLLAQQLKEVVGGLEQRRADALLHAGHHLAVDACQQQAGNGAIEQAGEDEQIKGFHKYIHFRHPL